MPVCRPELLSISFSFLSEQKGFKGGYTCQASQLTYAPPVVDNARHGPIEVKVENLEKSNRLKRGFLDADLSFFLVF